jgi:hypothetical protein
MEFRLTYQGPLRSAQRDPAGTQTDPRKDHKHAIRGQFHRQLKRLWEINPALNGRSAGPDVIVIGKGEKGPRSVSDLAARYSRFGFDFVPLVRQDLDLLCGIEILFLRADKPGKTVWYGDLDNRIKTLLDALTIPLQNDEYQLRTPVEDERPFYCLLEKDELITKLSIETDQLLEFVGGQDRLDDVRLVITVRLRPYELHVGNMHMG